MNDLTFVDYSLLFLLVSINIYFTYQYFIRIPQRHIILLPFTITIILYLIEYPLKVLLIVFPVIDVSKIPNYYMFEINKLLIAFAYATSYFIFFMVTVLYLAGKTKSIKPSLIDLLESNLDYVTKLASILGLISILVLLYRFYIGEFYTFSGYYKQSLIDIIFNNIALHPLAVFLLLYVNKKNKRGFNTILLYTLTLLVIFDSIMSTSKGVLVWLMIVYIFYKSIISEKIPLYPKIIFPFFFLLYFYYSYYARYFGIYTGNVDLYTVYGNMSNAYYNYEDFFSITWAAIFNRVEKFENLYITIQSTGTIDKGYFLFGSIAEIANIIPRFIWHDRPFLYFNYFVVENILVRGLKGVSSSIGRIGESFFILNYLGVIFGSIYAVISYYIYYKFALKAKSIFQVLIYLLIYFFYFTQDNYLFQMVANLILIVIYLSIIHLFISKKNQRLVNTPLK